MKKIITMIFCLYLPGIFLLVTTSASAQNAELKYSIMMNGSGMDLMTIQKNSSLNRIQRSLESNAKKRFIVSFEIHEEHTKVFQNNVMTTAIYFSTGERENENQYANEL